MDCNFTLKYISEAKRDYDLLNWYGSKLFLKSLGFFGFFSDGNLGDDSEEEGIVMLNLDQVCDEKPVKWVLMSSIVSQILVLCMYLRFFSDYFFRGKKTQQGQKTNSTKKKKKGKTW